ncbi:endo-1,4-beta-xylanase xylA, putative (macronuclear) [Tetrahymena thermophila SB210]|uniref:Endo-1,4-beta-xylanase xylA, putative n=1 Tax=Tetrahymena thermophila (strain SB210) TaxID=312017 RepID=I7M6K9_TETTS|nr:endo-1,4-beta-xylanase xylA, putative [Tetrahymena thermophila SB210]EAR85399.2 endo-1,4-beta-xylanase xylA, putative [Tetrahymena thermophila SB210]|eukprot:XP_001033062.2 endo-1,4-beta-xylanase xylA, putative [Tetrahymena thermophila SB210]
MQSKEYYFWKYDISLMNIISAIFWFYLNDFKLFEKSIEVNAILIIHLIQSVVHFIPYIQNKGNSIQHWTIVLFLIITTVLAFQLKQSVNHYDDDIDQTQFNNQNILYTWQIQSLIQLFIVLKLKYRMLLDMQRVIDIPFYTVILIILIQQILIAVLYTSAMLITIALVVYIGICYQQISYKIERKILLKEFNFYYINKLEKNACIQYNYSSKKVQTQKQKILQNLNDITQSTSEKQEEFGSSNISSQQKKSGSIVHKSDIEVNLNINKDNGDLGSKLKNKYQTNSKRFNAESFKFKDEDIRFLQNEFEQAKNKFSIEYKKQKSFLNIIKEQFCYGRQVINRDLYKKYQSLQINSGIHRLKGSLHIIKLPDNQEYGIILFKQSEQRIVDLYIQRIEQVQNHITLISKELSYMTANSSMPIPHSLDKSDIVINQTRTHQCIVDLNQDNGIANSKSIQPTKNQIESPGTLASHSNIEMTPYIQKRQTVNHYQSQSYFNIYHNNHSFTNINCLNDINPCISKTIQTQMQGNSFYAKHFSLNKNSTNTKNLTQIQQVQQQTQDLCQNCASNQQFSLLQQLIKCRFQIQILLNDLREYQLSCLELQYPRYKKYKTKWISHETKQRENYENEHQINQTVVYQQFQKDVYQQQQLIYFSNFAFLDIQVLDYIFSNDIQLQANNKKCKGVYDSVVNRIEDIYQQRTSITNLKILLDFFIKILSVGEKNFNMSLEQFSYIDSGLLQEQEKQQFRQVYGDQLIEENSDKVAANYQKTQTTGVFHQAQQGISNQTSPLISKTERTNFLFQEEDLETYKDMILSIIQQIFYLYKDNSSAISMQVHRFYSKEGIFNPQLMFRKRYLKEVIKSYLILEQNRQNQKNNQNQIGNQQLSQQFYGAKNLNIQNVNQKSPQYIAQKRNSFQMQHDKKQNEIQLPSISNIQHASSRIQPYKQINFQNPSQYNEQTYNNQGALDTPLKNQLNQQDSQDIIDNISYQKQQQTLNGANKNLLINQMSVQVSQAMSNSYQNNTHQEKNNGNYNQNSIQPFFAQMQQQITGKHAFQVTSMNDINQQSIIQSGIQNQEIKNNNTNNTQQIANDQSINFNAIGSSREAQQIDNQYIEEIIEQEKYRKLKLVRVSIKIDQSIPNDELTSQISKETNCLTQIEEYVQYLSPLPLFYSKEKKDATIIHTYSFYIQNYLYLNNLMSENDNQNQRSLMNLDQKMDQNNNQDIVSLDGQPFEQNQISQPAFEKKQTQNLREDNNLPITITQAVKEGQIKLNQQTLFQSSRQNFNDELFQNANNRASNTISFQQSHDNIESATDRKFLQSHNNLQIRDQQISFNGKYGGVQTPFQEINQDYTQIEIYPKDYENKMYSNININGHNDISNIGFTDRQVEEPSAERKLSKNMEKLSAKQEYNASQNLLLLGDRQKYHKNIQNFDNLNKNVLYQLHDENDTCIQENIREREKSSDNFVNQVRDSKSLIKNNQVQENQSQCSDLEYNKDVMDERDEKELSVIIERSEQNYSNINHYRNQLSKQTSSKINDFPFLNQNPVYSFLNQKSQFQSQLLPEDHKQTFSNNFSKNNYGIESENRSIIHPNIIGSVSQQYIQQLNSNISKEGNLINFTSQYYDSKLNKDGNQINYFSQNCESKLKQSN